MLSNVLRPLALLCALASLLVGCGRSAVPGSSALAAAEAAYQARKAWVGAALAPEPLAEAPLTDLATAWPGGRPISAQAEDRSVPIILVHGFGGFGRTDSGLGESGLLESGLPKLGAPGAELHASELRYWGGWRSDIEADLRSLGYQVFTASVGPLSSDWDRAAELYTQIKGGCVDYGAAHAQAAGHARLDPVKCAPGFYPEWDAEHPVNLIGHSMGASTSRTLVKLLEDGSPADAEGENLYAGGRRGWVRAVMTISGANTGSPVADNWQSAVPFVRDLVLSLAPALGAGGYDLGLGQFGIERRPGETFQSYLGRALAPGSALMLSEDQGLKSLQVDTALRQNAWIGRSTSTRYFSWAASATWRGLVTGWHYPRLTMFPLLMVPAYPYPRGLVWQGPAWQGLGNERGSTPGGVRYDASWWPNDGLAPVKVQHEPLGQSAEDYHGQPTRPGGWYRLGLLSGYDHLDVTGFFTLRGVKEFYRHQAAFLSSLD